MTRSCGTVFFQLAVKDIWILGQCFPIQTKRVKLPNGPYKQTGKVTLKKHYRWIDYLKEGQISLRAYVAKREDCKMSEKIRDQSRIKWGINSIRPFMTAGADEIAPSFLQQWTHHIVDQLVSKAPHIHLIVPQLSLGTSTKAARGQIRGWTSRKYEYWQTNHGHRQAKIFLKAPSANSAMELLNLNRIS